MSQLKSTYKDPAVLQKAIDEYIKNNVAAFTDKTPEKILRVITNQMVINFEFWLKQTQPEYSLQGAPLGNVLAEQYFEAKAIQAALQAILDKAN